MILADSGAASGSQAWNLQSDGGVLSVRRLGDNFGTVSSTPLTISAAGTLNVTTTTSASSSTVGALTVGNGTAATNVAIGGGNVNAGGGLTLGSNIEMGAATNIRFNGGTGLIYTGGYSYALSLQSSQLNLNTLSNSPITTGTGLATFGGAATFAGAVTAGGNVLISNPSSSAFSSFQAQNNNGGNATIQIGTSGSARAGTYFGLAEGNLSLIFANGTSSTGLGIGTFNANPLVLGTNNTAALTINATTQAATFAGKVTISNTTAGSAGAGALVVSGGLATGAASYFGGAVSVAASLAQVSINSSTGTNAALVTFGNTGGNSNIGLENSTGSLFGGTAYALIRHAPSGRVIQDIISGVPQLTISSTTATFAGAVAINNTTAAAVAAPSTHKVSILIGGVQYYLLASNV